MRAQALEVAQASVKPPGAPSEESAGQVAAIGLDASKLGQVLRDLGAGEHADKLVEGIANQLPAIIANAQVTAVGRAGLPAAGSADDPAARAARELQAK
eukprot:1051759-Pyramimonas_sp.AAC.1